MQPKKALGKGLNALIHAPIRRTPDSLPAAAAPAPAPGESVQRVPLSEVSPSSLQPRRVIHDEALAELTESIREHGVIQPLIVRARPEGGYELIAGERRWRATRQLALEEVPIIVRQASDREVLEMALIENLQREDLNPIEEAAAYLRLAQEFSLKQEEIARKVGKNRATVANTMRLLELASDVKDLLASGQLSVGHAKVLLALKDTALQRAAAEQIIRKGLTVRGTEQLVATASRTGSVTEPNDSDTPGGSPKKTVPTTGRQPSPEIVELEEKLRERYATKISIHHTEKKGRIEIEYFGNTDLDRILSLMGLASRYDGL